MNMDSGNWRQMLQITVLDWIAGGSQVIERRLHVAGIPKGAGTNDIKVETWT